MQTNPTTTSLRYVRSSRNANVFYTVALNTRGFWECECPAAQFNRGTPCKHCRAVAKDGAGLTATPKGQPVSRTHATPSVETRNAVADLDV